MNNSESDWMIWLTQQECNHCGSVLGFPCSTLPPPPHTHTHTHTGLGTLTSYGFSFFPGLYCFQYINVPHSLTILAHHVVDDVDLYCT